MTDTALSPEEQLIEDIAGFTHDPLGYALYAFPWGEEGTELAHATGPRQWQADAFREIRDHLQNPETRYQPLMLARASGQWTHRRTEQVAMYVPSHHRLTSNRFRNRSR